MTALVRPATPADADAAEALGRLVAAQELLVRYGVTPDGLGALLRRLALGMPAGPGETSLWLAQDAQGLCGLARFSRTGSLGQGGYLQLIALVPGREGGGLGAQLLLAVEAEVARDSQALFLLTSDFNHGAQRFYERHGYRQVGPLPDYARPGITELLYWKSFKVASATRGRVIVAA